jgi:hypothetical protein
LQGTNAHAVLCSEEDTPPEVLSAAAPWQKRRFWHTVVPHAMLESALPLAAEGRVQMQAQLRRPKLAFLNDHKVTLRRVVVQIRALKLRVLNARLLGACSNGGRLMLLKSSSRVWGLGLRKVSDSLTFAIPADTYRISLKYLPICVPIWRKLKSANWR